MFDCHLYVSQLIASKFNQTINFGFKIDANLTNSVTNCC